MPRHQAGNFPLIFPPNSKTAAQRLSLILCAKLLWLVAGTRLASLHCGQGRATRTVNPYRLGSKASWIRGPWQKPKQPRTSRRSGVLSPSVSARGERYDDGLSAWTPCQSIISRTDGLYGGKCTLLFLVWGTGDNQNCVDPEIGFPSQRVVDKRQVYPGQRE